jgi:integrase
MADVARFAYEAGHRSGEIRQLRWSNLEPDAIRVPSSITKNGEACQIVLTKNWKKFSVAERLTDALAVT